MKTTICLILSVLLFGCSGHKSILKKDTEEMTRLIDSTLQATHDFYSKLELQKINFLMDFIADHPACTIEPTLHILLSEYRCLSKQEIQLLARCRKNITPQAECGAISNIVSYSLTPRIRHSRHTTINLLGLIATYQHALANILTDETYDASLEIKTIQIGLDTLSKQALKPEPASVNTLPPGPSKSAIAVNQLSDMISSTRSQRHRFKDLQALVTEKAPAIDQALQDLYRTYIINDSNLSNLYELQLIQKSRQEYNRLPVSKRQALGTEQRKQMIKRYYEQAWQHHDQAEKADAIVVGLQGLINSHKQLQEGFKGHLTDKHRQRIAQENKARIKAVFKSIFDIVKYAR